LSPEDDADFEAEQGTHELSGPKSPK